MFVRTKAIALAAPFVLALAGCSEAADSAASSSADTAAGEPQSPATPEPSPTSADLSIAESGWLTVGSDGAVQTTFFDSGGRYRDLRNGEIFAEGEWQQRPDGRVCFEPETGRGACWAIAEPDATGQAIATNDEGKAVSLKRITYIAPPDEDDEEAGS